MNKIDLKNKILNNKKIIENFSYLSALQVFNMLLPLITYPYIIGVLGQEKYGLVIFAQTVASYLVIFVSFGFNISATKEVSIQRENRLKLIEIISSVFIIKIVLFLISLGILFFLIFFIPQAKSYEALFVFSTWAVLYDVVFPIWYFQGIEKMKYITYITLISRFLFLGLIFVFIHKPDDYLFIPIINGIGALMAGGVSLFIIFWKHKVSFKMQPIHVLKKYFIESIPIFTSNLSIKLYVNTNKVIIGTFLGMSDVASYDLAEKITSILKIPQSILSQSIFSRISREKNKGFIKRIFRVSMVINITLFILVLLFSDYLIDFLGGKQMLSARPVVWILGLTVPIVGISNIFGVQLLIPFGFNLNFNKVILSSGLFYIIILFGIWLCNSMTIINISLATLLTEIFVATYMFYYCKKNLLWN